VKPLDTAIVPLREALFRTLAEAVRCDVDYPPFDRAVMDGYAVRAEDVRGAPVSLRVTGQVAAGAAAPDGLRAGEAIQINTGAMIPPCADAVVRIEDTEADPAKGMVLIRTAVPVGQFITRRGAYVRAGRIVLEGGTRLTPVAMGAAASAGAASVRVFRRPTVAILSTGDELIDIAETPRGAMIRNSNEYVLEALVRSAHAEAVRLEVARDAVEVLRERIAVGLRHDVLCITGGVSMGTFDFVPKVLLEFGASFHVHKMAIKPGRPTIFATTPRGKLIFALPGNPASALVGFELLVRPALAALEGRAARPPLCRATLGGSLPPNGPRRAYVPSRVRVNKVGGLEVEPLSWQGSGDAFGMARADALIMRPPQSGPVNAGDEVSVLLLDHA
jgi:molybdopterin molybdotransferase